MSAYNSVNGDWCGENRQLLTDILRDEWGFDGFVISDWIFGLRDAAASVRAGLDVEMPYRMVRARHLAGRSPTAGSAADVDRRRAHRRHPAAFRRVLDRARAECVAVRRAPGPGARVGRQVRRAAPQRARRRHAGPPARSGARPRVAVIGRLAAMRNLGDGGSSDVWAPDGVTVLDGLRGRAGSRSSPTTAPISRGRRGGGGADVAMVVVGYTARTRASTSLATNAELFGLFPRSARRRDAVQRAELVSVERRGGAAAIARGWRCAPRTRRCSARSPPPTRARSWSSSPAAR